MVQDLMWFLGIIVFVFFLWVWGGGPERAEQKQLNSPVINSLPSQTYQD